MAVADQSPKGVLDPKSIKLAQLAALAVDFPKTGVPADLESLGWKVEQYPDFMNKGDKPSYPSTKVRRELIINQTMNREYLVYIDLIILPLPTLMIYIYRHWGRCTDE